MDHPRESQILEVLKELNKDNSSHTSKEKEMIKEESQVYEYIDTLDDYKLNRLKKQIENILERRGFQEKTRMEKQKHATTFNIDDIV